MSEPTGQGGLGGMVAVAALLALADAVRWARVKAMEWNRKIFDRTPR